ncbi:MAG: PhzF family phenazine biosynthesis protein [Candidatus Heimdallarchaeota archaeon]|nr:PhzF family phenazine biosynthesis protein [Candidatus Heimdallarchaeota archaeon]
MRQVPYVQTSVFIDDRYKFTGNQLATFWNKEKNNLTSEEMQGIALELNFSESTFTFQSDFSNCISKVRIFTPGNELKFAGHPTLGTAYVLKEKEIIPKNVDKVTLELGIGPINVEFFENEYVGMLQPKPQFMDKYTNKTNIAKILGINLDDISDKFPMQVVSTGFPFLIIPLNSLDSIKKINLNPNLQMQLLADFQTSKILVFATETIHSDSSVNARMFAPSVGVIEDPATGSAAGPLSAYLENWNILAKHKKGENIIIEQGYEIKRPSRLIGSVKWEENEQINILVSGKVKKTAEGEFFI